ncbi:MAG: TonB-dependent receptor [Ignavibacteriaceae bacterium]|nr:TonB-dependent receptor [Ignavibacteriaceae bacterium]
MLTVRILLFLFLISLIAEPDTLAQNIPTYQINDITVTASRTPTLISDLTRNIIVLGPEEIKNAPVNSVQGLLQYASGVDLAQRGVDGVQSDVSLRGGTFEETLILIDGVSVNDPQTGHHSMNLPVSLDGIQRIEILEGAGSSIYGADAFSGIINIITKKGSEKSFSLQTSDGQNGYYDGSLYAAYPVGIISSHLTLSRQKSDGFTHNTEFDITNFSYGATLNSGSNNLNLFFGYNDKKYGANSYYSVLFPNQWEHTTTKLADITGQFGDEKFSVSPKVYWRRNDDNYLLDYMNPSFYQNIHQTNVYGAEMQASASTGAGISTLGGEYTADKIESTNLRNHSRTTNGIFAEQKFNSFGNFSVSANAFAYKYPDIGWKIWPGINAGYNLPDNIKIFGSAGKAFRIPTYTELYYISPASVGNPNLQHEETTNYEAGITSFQHYYTASVSIFYKEGRNLIDWVRQLDTEPWTASNISEINTTGAEINLELNTALIIKDFPVYKVGIDYTYLNSSKTAGLYQSQYLMQYLRHQVTAHIQNTWWLEIHQSWELRYENRVNAEDYFLVDTQLYRSFGNWNIFLKATNLFNKSYYEVSGVPLPGRWITAGVKLTLGE